MSDGTVVVIDSNGEMTPVPGDQMTKLYDRLAGTGGVAGAEDRGIKEMIAIQAANAQMMKAMQEGRIDPKQVFNHLNSEGVRINQEANRAATDLRTLERADTTMMEDAAKAAHLARIEEKRAEVAQLKALFNRNLQSLNSVIRGGGTPGSAAYSGRPQGGGNAPWMMMNPITGEPMAGSGGGGRVTAPRFAPGSIARRAAGMGESGPGSEPGWGGGNRPPAPYSAPSQPPPVQVLPDWMYGGGSKNPPPSFNEGLGDTGAPQLGGMDINQVIAMLQAFGVGRA
jgi:hypothetical protein